MVVKHVYKTNLTAFTIRQAIEIYSKTDVLTTFGLGADTVRKYLRYDDKHEYNLSLDLRNNITDFINNPKNNLHNIYEYLLFHIAEEVNRNKDKKTESV